MAETLRGVEVPGGDVKDRLDGFLRHGLFQNVAFLSGLQISGYLFSLATIPYLTRVLGPGTWGLVALTLAFGAYVNLLVEYGFNLSATRDVSLHRDARDRLAELLSGVLGAKVLLSLVAVAVTFLAGQVVPAFREHPGVLWAGLFLALGQSFSLSWYYQGLERMRLVAVLEVSARALSTVGVFLLISSPRDGWKVLALQGTGALASVAVASALAHREVPFRLPTPAVAWKALRTGWTMFIYNGSSGLYLAASILVLGFFAPTRFVGYYAGAEKLVTAALGLFEPLRLALYPRMSYLIHEDRGAALRLARLGAVLMGAGGLVMGLVTFVFAPLIVRVVLGAEFAPAAPALRILALLFPLAALGIALQSLWMLPLRMDRPFTAIVVGTGLLNVLLALALAPRYLHLGVAWAAVAADVLMLVGTVYFTLRWRRWTPSSSPEPQA